MGSRDNSNDKDGASSGSYFTFPAASNKVWKLYMFVRKRERRLIRPI
jgi:hypothetical protein